MGKEKALGKLPKTNENTYVKHIEVHMLFLFTDEASCHFLEHAVKFSLHVCQLDDPFHSHLGIVLCESEGV